MPPESDSVLCARERVAHALRRVPTGAGKLAELALKQAEDDEE
jgi:hypothetical protein